MKTAHPHFSKIYIEISNICNLKCQFCPTVDREAAVMGPDQFRSILPKIQGLADRYCLHVMGEPVNHPQFSEIVAIASRANLPLEITTNGTRLNPALVHSLLDPTVKQVNFSIQSFIDNFRTADPTVYFEKILNFCQLSEEKRPDLYVNFRLWNINSDARQVEMTQLFVDKIEKHFETSINLNVDPTFKKSKNIRGRFYLHFDSRFEWPHIDNPILRTNGYCHGGQKQIAILTEGTVVPCCFDKEANISLGSIFENSLLEILETSRYQNLVNGFNNNEIVEDLCQRCSFSQRFKKRADKISLN